MGALPNLFSYPIMDALVPGATAESVAMAIASSDKFIEVVRRAMADDVPDQDTSFGPKYPMASHIRVKIARAFASETEIIDH